MISPSASRTLALVHGIPGWRAWRLANFDGADCLQSLGDDDVWTGPIFIADEPPWVLGWGHRGIHAFRPPLDARRIRAGAAIVYGRVILLGEVHAYQHGFRAERARIDQLFLRACGWHRHRMPVAPDSDASLTGIRTPLHPLVRYCGCDALSDEAWLTPAQLQELAAGLGRRYQCCVAIDPERARVPRYFCRDAFMLTARTADLDDAAPARR